MAEGVFVQHFITCEKLSQVEKMTQKYTVLSVKTKSINS